ncbi:DUF1636 family protein [Sinorhizobium terangae]|uniref:DUF1636 domain-containing protein n=1 Tax=Sinorhizobium terangae TaxID=110322 RepID=A0A6N7LB34_SINTE|nr:DUF1636 domain-containing protein [Sinorhizobium terangae]MBB4188065.1 putative metal-binding protein [Sinorhizobium terangae]MQX14438.1 DUF1636 domain-containing protein [Sinorhizobium terangae]WFU49481.1 DUF1636 domain-containing protein [Sinorhizobium terangae]
MANSDFRQHKITLCTDCRFPGGPCRPGTELLAQLNHSVSALGRPLDRDFSIAGTVAMAACTRPCTIAFQATARATYLFGDISPEEDIDDLVSFAAAYAEGQAFDPFPRPALSLTGKGLARIPAAVLVSEETAGWLQ